MPSGLGSSLPSLLPPDSNYCPLSAVRNYQELKWSRNGQLCGSKLGEEGNVGKAPESEEGKKEQAIPCPVGLPQMLPSPAPLEL